ncbi:pyridoxal-dependent decarboxylase [Paenibacillus sp. FSL W8-0186]|uniref:Decarboxylase n=1 Tax=Paenibacillus woosongensis TaxID=307580 RepID=A0ABQ4MTM0_9BACL|nr:pyridoxal-dependent decarboxylase [Paenibacillus woosongensis]GIP59272.1 hypothetical protein J15TS10_30860 [Paenibacillus woosongensis]
MGKKAKLAAKLFAERLEQHLEAQDEQERLDLEGPGSSSLESWFIGPKAENEELFSGLIQQAVKQISSDRREYFPDDPIYITDEIKQSPSFKNSVDVLTENYSKLLEQLSGSVPFYSYRYQAHMNWDLTMPGLLGYFAAMLYNQNNVAAESSPVTTVLEMVTGDDLCEMLGYTIPSDEEIEQGAIRPWGHITCDGSVANLEAMWAARNLKYYAVSAAEALKNEADLAAARQISIPLLNGQHGVLTELDAWTLLNLKVDDVLAIPGRIAELLSQTTGKDEAETVNQALSKYTLQTLGFEEFSRKYLFDVMQPAAILVTSTMHYSWPKSAAVLGMGASSIIPVPVNMDARMEISELRQRLDQCLAIRQPVLMTVCVIGSTEESAVDPIADVIQLREEYRERGLEFVIHADAAWGGYFASILREDTHKTLLMAGKRPYTPAMTMNEYVTAQYEALKDADSITIDPHKAGYIPYPAGGLCYRNSSMRDIVSFQAPVVYHGGIDPTVGIYGIEGSKPGAAAAGVYLSHRVIRTDQSGYGKLLGKTLFNSKRLYAAILTMTREDDPFIVVPFHRIPAEREGGTAEEIKEQLAYIKEFIVDKTNDEIINNKQTMELFRQLGSDQSIVPYTFNLKTAEGLNTDVALMNRLNLEIFKMLSLSPDRHEVGATPMFITQSAFDPGTYGHGFVDAYKQRLGLSGGDSEPVNFLLSTTMSPFLTDTSEGNFIPVLIEALRETVFKAIENIKVNP